MFTRGNERTEETNDYKKEWKLIYRRYFPPYNFHFIYLMEIVVLSYFFFSMKIVPFDFDGKYSIF